MDKKCKPVIQCIILIIALIMINSCCNCNVKNMRMNYDLPEPNNISDEEELVYYGDKIRLQYAKINSNTLLTMLDTTAMSFISTKKFNSDSLDIYVRYFTDNRRENLDSLEKTLVISIEKTCHRPWSNQWVAYSKLNNYIIFLDAGAFQQFSYFKGPNLKKYFFYGDIEKAGASYYWEFKQDVVYTPFIQTETCIKIKPSDDYGKRIFDTEEIIMTDGNGDIW